MGRLNYSPSARADPTSALELSTSLASGPRRLSAPDKENVIKVHDPYNTIVRRIVLSINMVLRACGPTHIASAYQNLAAPDTTGVVSIGLDGGLDNSSDPSGSS